MNDKEHEYFQLPLESLRSLAGWCADCAEFALPVFEKHVPSDRRPQAAIDGIRIFAADGARVAKLRTLALAAFSAARAAHHPAASAAARAAGLAAASAYTHPLVDVAQTKHVVGPAAQAALALELDPAGGPMAGENLLRWAIEHVPVAARDILRHMPGRQPGRSRLDRLMYELDTGIRMSNLMEDDQGPGPLKT